MSNVRVVTFLVIALVLAFALYVLAERRVDRVNEARQHMLQLASELRQSSDELTRMARTYVLTGEAQYQQRFQEILDIRDGKIPRPPHYGVLSMGDDISPEVAAHHADEAPQAVALLDLLLRAGANAQEQALLATAKRRSDELTRLEYQAMALVAPANGVDEARRAQAVRLLYDASYHRAKASITEPVTQFLESVEHRSAETLQRALWQASLLRVLVIVLGLVTLASLGLTQHRLRTSERERKDTLGKLQRLTQIYAALSESSKAMVRCHNRQELFDLVCRAAVKEGALQMAWIGLVDAASGQVKPVALHGSGTDYVQTIRIDLDPNSPFGQGPNAQAIRTDAPYWCQDFQRDPRTEGWRDRALEWGCAGSASLPLHQQGQVIGVLNVYSAVPDTFDAQVQGLLLEMAADIDYALHALEQDQARRLAQERMAVSESRLQMAYRGSRDALWEWNLLSGELHYSPRWWEMIGWEPDALPVDDRLWRRVMHPQDLPRILAMLKQQMNNGSDSFSAECRLQHRDGHSVPVLVRAFIMRDASGKIERVAGTNMDLTERVQSQQMDSLRGMMLERLTGRMTLPQLLDAYVRKLETALEGVLCSIVLLEEGGLRMVVGAAPSMPKEYEALLLRTQVSPRHGPSAHALSTGQRVVVEDLARQPYSTDYLSFVHRHALTCCWAEPIRAGDQRLLGAIVVYRRSAVQVKAHEFALVGMAAHITAIAIERRRSEQQLQLAETVFEQGGELIMITDASGRLVRVNQAFVRITGYSEEEALGRRPSMLSSGHHDADFYQTLWRHLDDTGYWQGEIINRRKDGSTYPEWLSISRLSDANGQTTHYVGIGTDITQRKLDEEKIRMLADFDPLTGLPNRRLLQDRVANALSAAQRQQEKVALIFLDLDRFKNVNDSLGHPVGDELLVQVAQRLSATVRQQDTVCRMGGDEFVLLCPDTDASGAAHLAQKLLDAICQRYQIQGQELSITTSLGVAIYPDDGDSFDALSMRADTAMYRAKQDGRNGFRFFTAEMQEQSARALQLENGLRRALESGQLSLVYQPQVSLHTHRVLGVEALIRWNHPTLGAVSPAEFIPVAEDSGLILPIGEWVIRTALRQWRAWQDAGLDLDLVAVNLSAVQFRQPNLPALVSRLLVEEGVAPHHLELELTEGVALQDPVGAIDIMARLHERGVRMSIDDFGTGYSSLNYLKRFNVYKLKIDQSFVRDITDDAEDRAIVEAIIGLARSLGFQTIAEGVETEGQLALLRAQGCDEVQGYYFSRPLAPQALQDYVLQQQGL